MLNELIRRIHEEGSPEAYKAFADEFRDLAEHHHWVAVPGDYDENGLRLGTSTYNGETYFVMFSDEDLGKCAAGVRVCGCKDMGVFDINSVIDAVYNYKDCPGILIDPQGPRTMVIPRSSIEFLTGRRDPWL